MKDQISQIQKQFADDMANASSPEAAEELRVKYLGRKKGLLNDVLRGIKDLSPEEKREIGPLANTARKEMEQQLDNLLAELKGEGSAVDITLPGIRPQRAHRHPLTMLEDELIAMFRKMGFMVHEGVELDHDYYNFDALNFEEGHSARDMHDTFFIKDSITRKEKHDFEQAGWLLRTHTTNMQVRIMEEHEPPLRCVVPGRVYRNEATDASHEYVFNQFDGFVVGKNITIGHLKWFLKEMFHQLYGENVNIRLRPGYFPFVEPGFEVDMSSDLTKTGWLEMLGAGMIHPNVLKAAGYPEGEYTGFAFGVGTTRLTMMKYGIRDIRSFMQSDMRFLEQF